jgi:hypothetical protein
VTCRGVTWPSGSGASSIVSSEAAVLGRKALPLFTECRTPRNGCEGSFYSPTSHNSASTYFGEYRSVVVALCALLAKEQVEIHLRFTAILSHGSKLMDEAGTLPKVMGEREPEMTPSAKDRPHEYREAKHCHPARCRPVPCRPERCQPEPYQPEPCRTK